MKRKPLPPGVYVRLDAADLRHVERHMKRMQREAEGKITQSDAIRALIRAGVAADTPARMTGGASRGSDKKVVLTKRIMAAPSELCSASYPDSEQTGFPVAHQRYAAHKGTWEWIFVGSEPSLTSPKQMEADYPSDEGLVRRVWVQNWSRAGNGRLWRARLDTTRTVYQLHARRSTAWSGC